MQFVITLLMINHKQKSLGLMLKGEKRHFRELAEYVKKEFDNRFPGTWHVIVGKRIITIII